jgi:hypothetical protein
MSATSIEKGAAGDALVDGVNVVAALRLGGWLSQRRPR